MDPCAVADRVFLCRASATTDAWREAEGALPIRQALDGQLFRGVTAALLLGYRDPRSIADIPTRVSFGCPR